MNQLDFGTVPRTFKKVKTVKLYLAGENGESVNYDVPFYLRTAGEPAFAVAPPAIWISTWQNHKSQGDQYRQLKAGIKIDAGVLTAPSFEVVQEALQALSENYAQHIKTLSMKPVIVLALEISVPGTRSVNPPSFSGSKHLVGVRAERGFDINGRFYGVHDWSGSKPYDPAGMSLNDMHPSSVDKGIKVPYSDAAWATVQQIEQTLDRAGAMLAKLADREQTQTLLEGGMPALLEGPKAPTSGILAGEPEVLGERCKDGGKCHHSCTAQCFRREVANCVPLGASGLTDSWEPQA
jgi:hypothetical protein